MRKAKLFKIPLLLLVPLLVLLMLLPQHSTQALCFSSSDSQSSAIDYTDDGYVSNLMAKSDIVALGTLTFVSDNPWPPIYTLTVEKHWKGDVKNGETLTIRDGAFVGGGGPCGGIGVRSGQRYLLFLSDIKKPTLSVNHYQPAPLDTELPSQFQSTTQQMLRFLHIPTLNEEWSLIGAGLSLVIALVLLLVWLRLKPKSL